MRRKVAELRVQLTRLRFLVRRQMFPCLHAVEYALLLLRRKRIETIEPLAQLFLPLRRKIAESRIAFESLALLGWRHVFVATQPIPGMIPPSGVFGRGGWLGGRCIEFSWTAAGFADTDRGAEVGSAGAVLNSPWTAAGFADIDWGEAVGPEGAEQSPQAAAGFADAGLVDTDFAGIDFGEGGFADADQDAAAWEPRACFAAAVEV